ncbi:MAG TPA: type 4a pilus biogenesis protein PilO [Burkholderiaceae bacterium]|jgi:type IV pilus assembly protein PilO|nr:type 4a pilus biogenesis protein PilO [Burkholderiaceae bacterium]
MADLKQIGTSVAAQFRGLNGRHPGQWPIVPRLMCALGVFVAVLGLAWYFLWSSQLDELDTGAQAEVKLREAYTGKIHEAINLDALLRQKAQVAEYVSTLEKALPNKAEMAALLEDISHAGLGRSLQFEQFKPGQVLVKDYYAEQPIDIKITGSYHDIGAFSSDIANLPRIVTLNNLAVVSKDGTLTLDAVAKTFRYLDSTEVSEQRKGKGSKK